MVLIIPMTDLSRPLLIEGFLSRGNVRFDVQHTFYQTSHAFYKNFRDPLHKLSASPTPWPNEQIT